MSNDHPCHHHSPTGTAQCRCPKPKHCCDHHDHYPHHHSIENQIMATVQQAADQISTLAENAAALTTAVNTLVANQGTAQQAAFEAQLDPLVAALGQVNSAISTLVGVVNTATGATQ